MNSQPIIKEDNLHPFQIKVKLLSNEVHEFQIQKQMQVSAFKDLIKDKVGVPPQKMRIVFSGKQLLDDKPICEYVSQSGLTVHLIAKSSQPNQPQQQNPQSNQRPPNSQSSNSQPPNPLGNIMGMMGNMFGPNGNTQTATMSFNNMNDLNNRMQNMFEGLGIRLPQPPQQPQQPRQPQQPQQSQQSQPQNNQSQESSRRQRISYSGITGLNQNLNKLNLPIQNVITEQQYLNKEGLARYLRRLQHQNTRALSQLNRAIHLLEEGNISHLSNFIPVFQSLNQTNNIAIESIKKVVSQNQPQVNNSNSQSQEPNVSLPRQNIPNVQSQSANMPIGNLLGGLDLGGMLNSVGGMNGLFNLTLGQMMEENEQGEGGRKPILIYLFEDITGQNIMQSFTTKDFSYLNVRHASIRQRLIKRIEEEGREQVVKQITAQIQTLLVPQNNEGLTDIERCKQQGRQVITGFVQKWVDITLQQNPQRYSDKAIALMKLLFGDVMSSNIRFVPNNDENLGFLNLKRQVVGLLASYLPGLGQMFYTLIEKELRRVFQQYKQEMKRKKQRSIEETANEEMLMKLIKQYGEKDSEYLSKVQHSKKYGNKN